MLSLGEGGVFSQSFDVTGRGRGTEGLGAEAQRGGNDIFRKRKGVSVLNIIVAEREFDIELFLLLLLPLLRLPLCALLLP